MSTTLKNPDDIFGNFAFGVPFPLGLTAYALLPLWPTALNYDVSYLSPHRDHLG
jgi:hypothetical protein